MPNDFGSGLAEAFSGVLQAQQVRDRNSIARERNEIDRERNATFDRQVDVAERDVGIRESKDRRIEDKTNADASAAIMANLKRRAAAQGVNLNDAQAAEAWAAKNPALAEQYLNAVTSFPSFERFVTGRSFKPGSAQFRPVGSANGAKQFAVTGENSETGQPAVLTANGNRFAEDPSDPGLSLSFAEAVRVGAGLASTTSHGAAFEDVLLASGIPIGGIDGEEFLSAEVNRAAAATAPVSRVGQGSPREQRRPATLKEAARRDAAIKVAQREREAGVNLDLVSQSFADSVAGLGALSPLAQQDLARKQTLVDDAREHAQQLEVQGNQARLNLEQAREEAGLQAASAQQAADLNREARTHQAELNRTAANDASAQSRANAAFEFGLQDAATQRTEAKAESKKKEAENLSRTARQREEFSGNGEISIDNPIRLGVSQALGRAPEDSVDEGLRNFIRDDQTGGNVAATPRAVMQRANDDIKVLEAVKPEALREIYKEAGVTQTGEFRELSPDNQAKIAAAVTAFRLTRDVREGSNPLQGRTRLASALAAILPPVGPAVNLAAAQPAARSANLLSAGSAGFADSAQRSSLTDGANPVSLEEARLR